MRFNASVHDNGVRVSGSGDIRDIMLAITMIVDAINDSEAISECDKYVFRNYIREELPKLAFASQEEVDAECKRIEEKRKDVQENITALLRKFLEDLS